VQGAPEINVGAICKRFGGGGHKQAASATIKELTPIQVSQLHSASYIHKVKDKLFAHLYSSVGEVITSKDIMTKGVIFIPSCRRVKEASVLFSKFSIKKMPVIDTKTKKCIGILDNAVTQMAVLEMDSHPVTEIMDNEFDYVSPDDPLDRSIGTYSM
jgi:tRNA nucleotidyltransferase (CCA-adding enzyme)